MVEPSERRFIYYLRKEELQNLLKDLEADEEGSVHLLRVRLTSFAKEATPEEVVIFKNHKQKYEERKDVTVFRDYAARLPFSECKEVLEEFEGDTEASEEIQREALAEALNQTRGKDREGWLEVAEHFSVKMPLNNSTMKPDVEQKVEPQQKTQAESQASRSNCVSEEETSDSEISDEAPRPCRKTSRSYYSIKNHLPKMAILMEQVRKWNLKFRGESPDEALKFIEDLEEKAGTYEIPLDKLPKAMPEFLVGKASSWYRSNKEDWPKWEDFRDSFLVFFVPTRMRVELEDEVRAYKQGPNQRIYDYIVSIQSLMRRVTGLSEIEKLNRIYANLSCEYQLNIKRNEFKTLKGLKVLGEDYEYKIKNRDENVAGRQNIPNQRHVQRTKDFPSNHRNSTITVETQDPPQNQPFSPVQAHFNPFRQDPKIPRNPVNQDSNRDSNLQERSPRPQYTCYNCDMIGHTSRYCRKPRKPYCSNCKTRVVSTENCNCKEGGAAQSICPKCRRQGFTAENCICSVPSNSNITPPVKEAVSTTDHSVASCTDKRPRREVEILGKTFTALLDSGATTSYINRRVVEWLKANNKTCIGVKVCTYMANRALECTDRSYKLEMRVGNKNISSIFLVMEDMSDDITIGEDCLEMLNYELIEVDRDPRIARMSSLVHREELEPSEEAALKSFLEIELEKCSTIKGGTNKTEHRLTMKNDIPIRQRYFPKNPKMREIIYKQVDELLENGQIEASASPYCSPIVLVKKKDNTWRMCIDFRKINENSIRDSYPMPHIPSILSRLQKARYVSSIDLKNGYWQVSIHPLDRQYTAFVVPGRGLFQWRVMPFGLHSAPATFQRLLDTVISREFEDFAVAYLDDIIIFSESFQEHLVHVEKVLNALREANLRINFDKSVFCKKQLRYLGHIVGQGGVQTDPEKVKAINELTPPTDVSGVRRVLGMAAWYSKFVPNFTDVVAPINELLAKKNPFHWGERQQQAFENIKRKMTEAPIIACPDYSRPFFLQTDASGVGLGAVLFQREGENERVIAYSSRALKPAEKNYTTTEKECLAVIWGIEKNREYLEGIPFTVITDHLSLKWIFKLQNPTGRLGRWVLELNNYDFEIEYRKGKLNVVPDALSRDPISDSETQIEMFSASTVNSDAWLDKKIKEINSNPEKFPEFQVLDGQLMRNYGRGDVTENNWKLYVNKSDRIQVLNENHVEVTAGHFGIRKTFDRICKNYFWPGLHNDVRKFVNRCHECLRFKSSQQKPAGKMNTTQTSTPWEIITIDFVGPLPRSSKQNKYLLVMQDKFTKWVECVPLREATATGVKKAIRERIFTKFGWPKKLISDNGSQFTAKAFVSFLKENFVLHVLTPPYSPQCNATERANRTLKTMIKIYIDGDQKKWDDKLPEIQFALNTAVNESTGFSPAEMNFGRDLRPPKTLFEEKTVNFSDTLANSGFSKDKIDVILKIARRNLAKAQQSQAKHYNKKRRDWSPKIHELVYKKEFFQSKAVEGFTAKLSNKFSGPYKVVSYVSPSIVEIEDDSNPSKKRIMRVHLKDLKEINQEDFTFIE